MWLMGKKLRSSIGLKLQTARKSRGFTQERLAERCDLSVNTISTIERGIHFPTFDNLIKMCRILDIQISDIVDNPADKSTKRIKNEAEAVALLRTLSDDKLSTAVKIITTLK